MAQPATVPNLILDDTLSSIAVSSVQNAFNSLFGVNPVPGTPVIGKESSSKGDISGILGMIQDRVEATLVVSFQKQTIFTVLSLMYGREFDSINDTVKQGVGELTNIIYASVKKDLNLRGHKFKMSIPNVVIGANHSIYNIHDGRTLVIPFRINDGEFFVEITLQGNY